MATTVTTTATTGKTWDGGNEPMGASYGKMMMWFFIVSDALTFSGFLAAYGFSRFKFIETWPIADEVFNHFPFMHGKDAPMYYVALMTFILIFSSVTMVLAVDDYSKAGFYMLPTGKKDKKTAVQIILYTAWLLFASLLPVTGFTGELKLSVVSAVIVFLLGLWMLVYGIKLYNKMDGTTAKKLMLVSVSYISLLQVIYVLDKFIR